MNTPTDSLLHFNFFDFVNSRLFGMQPSGSRQQSCKAVYQHIARHNRTFVKDFARLEETSKQFCFGECHGEYNNMDSGGKCQLGSGVFRPKPPGFNDHNQLLD